MVNTVENIIQLQNFAGAARTIIVTDEILGGTFNFSDETLTPDGVNIISATGVGEGYWVRFKTSNLFNNGDGTSPFVTQEELNSFEDSFTYSGSQNFELSFTPTNNISLYINGQFIEPSQYSIDGNVLTVIDTLQTGDSVYVKYSHVIIDSAVYSKVEVDTMLQQYNKVEDVYETPVMDLELITAAVSATGKHLAFGSIERIKALTASGLPNKNLMVYREGNSHALGGIIKGIYISDNAEPIGEPFTIASQTMYPNIGRGATTTPNDFRDPNVKLLPDGKVMLTFLARNWVGVDSTVSDTYIMIGTYDNTFNTISWSTPVFPLSDTGFFFYGKPIIVGTDVYCGAYSDGDFDPESGDTDVRIWVVKSTLTTPTVWETYGDAIQQGADFLLSEPVLREKPSGGYFILYRYDSNTLGIQNVLRVDSEDLLTWTEPAIVFEDSCQIKGIEITPDERMIVGLRYTGSPNGVAILTSKNTVDVIETLTLSNIIYSSTTASNEAGYLEFTSLGADRYLGMFHTEGGKFIKTFTFKLSDVMDKKVNNNYVGTFKKKSIGAERLSASIHISNSAARSHNLVKNPTFHLPYGFLSTPYWTGTIGVSSSGDPVGAGYPKVTASSGSGTIRNYVDRQLSRMYAGMPVILAYRVFCLTPNRLTVRFTFGNTFTSQNHNGTGWETLYIMTESDEGKHSVNTGGITSDMIIESVITTGSSVDYYPDYISLSFGETVPEVINDSAQRLFNMAHLTIPTLSTSFLFADLGMTLHTSTNYRVNVIEANFAYTSYTVTKTTTGFTLVFDAGAAVGSSARATIEIIG